MPADVKAYLSPLLFDPAQAPGAVAIIIDQLRASTTIATALAAGAAALLPCEEVDEARGLAKPGFLLGGERAGVCIEGFDLGNSPREYTPARVAGRTIAFTTTNGTRALLRARDAHRVYVGALVNRTAVARAAAAHGMPVVLICAGIRDGVCAEDVLAAGAIAAALQDLGLALENDAARLSLALWQPLSRDRRALLAALHASRGGRNLAKVGLADDVEASAAIDSLGIVPVYRDGRILPEGAAQT